jgi:hypothetical protein
MDFIEKKVSTKRAIAMLTKNGIQVSEEDANIILDFLYLIAKNCNKSLIDQDTETLRRYRTPEKMP